MVRRIGVQQYDLISYDLIDQQIIIILSTIQEIINENHTYKWHNNQHYFDQVLVMINQVLVMTD